LVNSKIKNNKKPIESEKEPFKKADIKNIKDSEKNQDGQDKTLQKNKRKLLKGAIMPMTQHLDWKKELDEIIKN